MSLASKIPRDRGIRGLIEAILVASEYTRAHQSPPRDYYKPAVLA